MDKQTKTVIKGWGLVLFSVLVLWGLNNVMIGYSAKVLQVNYLIYTCCGFMSASLMLLAIGGLRDDLARETLRSFDTFVFGLIMLFAYLITLSLFFYTSATEGAFLQRVSLVFSLVIAWIFMQRKPTFWMFCGSVVVLIGIGFICQQVSVEYRGMIYAIMFLEGAFLTARTFAAENHKTYNKALKNTDPKLKTRVLGFVMFIVSIIFILFSLSLAWVQTYYPIFKSSSIVPVLSDFYDYKSIFAGLVAGVLLITPLRLIEFYGANIIKSENVLAVAALSPFATLFWEWIFQPLTGLQVSTISNDSLFAGGIITVGCLIVAISQILKIKKHGVEEWRDYVKMYDPDDSHVYHSQDIIKKTIQFFDGDYSKVSEALDISLDVIHKIIDNENYGFRNSESSRVMANFKDKVTQRDYLTKVYNRTALDSMLDKLISKNEEFCIMFIDLDKFKPVNDTYGHDAGDAVLKTCAERLLKLESENIKVARFGGDEFILVLKNYKREHVEIHISRIENIIKETICFEDKEINVGASAGVAEFGLDGATLEEIFQSADANMYAHKQGKR